MSKYFKNTHGKFKEGTLVSFGMENPTMWYGSTQGILKFNSRKKIWYIQTEKNGEINIGGYLEVYPESIYPVDFLQNTFNEGKQKGREEELSKIVKLENQYVITNEDIKYSDGHESLSEKKHYLERRAIQEIAEQIYKDKLYSFGAPVFGGGICGRITILVRKQNDLHQ